MRRSLRAAALLPAAVIVVSGIVAVGDSPPTLPPGRGRDPARTPFPAWGVLYPRGTIGSRAPLLQFVTPGESGDVWATVRLDGDRTFAASLRGRTLPWPPALGPLRDGEGGIVTISARGRAASAVFRRRAGAPEDPTRCELPGWRAWFGTPPSGTIPPGSPFAPLR
jgi:hypothetical protein